jgi:biotin-dependent carboxylase-like uncharacterized protein
MITVIHPGIYISVQDKGRIGFAKKGIPQGGYMDAYAAEMANLLLKNEATAAVLEVTFGQGQFAFSSDLLICLTGGDFSPQLDNMPIKMNKVIAIKKHAVLSFGKRQYGARVYIGVQGGVQSETILKSKSFFPGITPKIRLEKGDTFTIDQQKELQKKGYASLKVQEEHFKAPELDCYPGPEFEQLNAKQKKQLCTLNTVSSDTNRVGYRLQEVIANELPAILTSAVLPGTVQLTPSGTLIVLMRDCQVTGGYPRVLQLSETAISRLSQKVAGDEVQFRLIDL